MHCAVMYGRQTARLQYIIIFGQVEIVQNFVRDFKMKNLKKLLIFGQII